jgi:ABC-type Mn2+/Zn2+ transport system permease subunit
VALAGRVTQVGRDTAISVVVTTLFGAGVLLALSPASPPGIESLLFGDILGLSVGDLAMAAGLATVLGTGLWVGQHRLLAAGFDRTGAPALGVSPGVADAALLVALAATILVAVQALGNLLVVAVLVAPAATARLHARRLPALLAGAAAAAIAAGVGGLYVSYYARVAAGASVAGTMVARYIAAAAAGRLRALR